MGGSLTPNTHLLSSVYPLRRKKPPCGGRHKTDKGMGRVGVKLSQTAKYFLHSPPQTNTGSELGPALTVNRWPHQLSTLLPGSLPGTKLATNLKEKATANWRVGKLCTQELR